MPIDPTRLAQARALKAQGFSLRKIGRELGVSHVALRKWPLATEASVPELVQEADQHITARRQVRTPADGRDWLAKLWAFLAQLEDLAGNPQAEPFERRMAAQTGAELALSAFELTAELEETEAGARR